MTQPPYDHYKEGITSLLEASEDYELAPLGISSLQKQAEKLAEFGRNGDIYVVHAAEGETVVPMEVLDANPQIKSLLFNQMEEMGLDPNRYVVGNEFNSLNPVTGMPEFFLKKIFKSAKKVFKKVKKLVKKIAPIAIPIAASFFGIPFLPQAFFAPGMIGSAALGSGIGTLIGGGSFKDALKSAAIAGAGAGIMGGAKGFLKAAPGQSGWDAFKAGVSQAAYNPAAASAVATSVGQDAITRSLSKSPEFSYRYGGEYAGVPKPPNFTVNPNLSGAPVSPSPTGGTIQLSPEFAAQQPAPLVTDGPIKLSNLKVPSPQGPETSSFLKDLKAWLPSSSAKPTTIIDPTNTDRVLDLTNNADLARYTALQNAGYIPKEGLFGGTGPLGLPEITGSKLADTAIYGGGAYLTADALGAFTPAEPEDPRETADAARDVFDPIVIDPVLAEQSEIDVSTQIPTSTAEELLQPTLFSADGGSVQKMAVGGYPRRELLVEGPGTERSDDIPAMLSDGEFVINSKAVRGADPSGRGNRYAGAQNLYNIMRNFEMRA